MEPEDLPSPEEMWTCARCSKLRPHIALATKEDRNITTRPTIMTTNATIDSDSAYGSDKSESDLMSEEMDTSED
jgi:hypothetical protein